MTESRTSLLIVDDATADVEMLNDLFQADYEVFTALSGEEGIEAAQELAPNLVVANAMLTDMDGFALCQRLRDDSRTREIPVLLLSALGEETEAERGLLSGVADFLAKPIDPHLARLRIGHLLAWQRCREKLHSLTDRDELTGLANRRQLEHALEHEWQRALRHHRPLSLVRLEVDYLEEYRLRYGDLMADEVLRMVARELKGEMARPGDLLARFSEGGFACLLPETDREGAWLVAEKLRLSIGDLGVPHADSPLGHVSLSGGTATATAEHPHPPAELLNLAERTLAAAQEKGRNQVLTTP